ncbi:MAG: carbon-nitrogen hydrolase family protein [Actinomycetota bacterium]
MPDAPELSLAVCQFAPTASREDNRARLAELATEAANRGARVVVFPEYSSYFVDPLDESFARNAEPLDGPFVSALTDVARAHGLVIIAGLAETDAGGGKRVRNAVVAVDGDGLRAVYRKQHLYDAFGQTESTWVEPGDLGEPAVLDVDGFRLGLMTCYDLRFPEVARTLVDAGADVIVVPAEWVRGPLKEYHWTTLLAARAIENTAYVVSADHPAPVGVGLSQILDPQGVVLAGVGSGDGIAVALLRQEVLAKVREVNPALRLRRYAVTPR